MNWMGGGPNSGKLCNVANERTGNSIGFKRFVRSAANLPGLWIDAAAMVCDWFSFNGVRGVGLGGKD